MFEMQKSNVAMKLRKCRKIRTTYPNNVYFVGESDSVCEVLSESAEVDEMGEKKKRCRVYIRPTSVFKEPCDSRLIGFFKCDKRLASIREIPVADLTRQVIMVNQEDDRRNAVFMAILHGF